VGPCGAATGLRRVTSPRFVILDTDVASKLVKRQGSPELLNQLAAAEMCLTFVSVGEMTKWLGRRQLGQRRRNDVEDWIASCPMVAVDKQVAEVWGDNQAAAELRGRPRPNNDAWVAACCLVEGLPLATYNLKDFEDFAEYEGLRLISL
jgi:predicted nucleic acid-binding protein